MKPISLELCAFGPFADQQRVEFDQLGPNPLFLINGPTGAGKSSLLDAICFALYGATTGAERDAAQMRCDHAPLERLTEVSLRFSLGEQTYRVRRTPTQERPKARGDGSTTAQAEAQLWCETATALSAEGELLARGVKEVTDQIRSLIGLDVEQFRQVMVLPQGKFRELLMADSKERERIFGQLFQTRIYRRIEEALKEQAAGIRKAVEQHQERIRGLLAGADLNSEAAIATEQAELAPALAAAAITRAEAEAQRNHAATQRDHGVALQQRFDELARSQQQLQQLQAREGELQGWQQQWQLAQAAQQLSPLQQRWQHQQQACQQGAQQLQRSGSELQVTESTMQEAATALAAAQQAQGAVEGLKEELRTLNGYRAQIEQLHQARARLSADTTTGQQGQQALAQLQHLQRQRQEEQQQLESSQHDLQQRLEPFTEQQLQLQSLSQQLLQRQQLEQLRSDYKRLKLARTQAEQQWQHSSQQLQQAEHHSREQELHWHQGQAALLAQELQQDQPCPVCGSCSHPAPAQPQAGVALVTQEQVNAARLAEQQAREQAQRAREQLDAAQRALEDNQREGGKLRDAIGALAEQPLAEVVGTEQQLRQAVTEQQQRKVQLQQHSQRLVGLKTELAQLESQLSAQQLQLEQQQKAQIEANFAVQQLEQQLPADFRAGNALQQAVTALQQRIDTLEQGLQRAQQQAENCRTQHAKAQANQAALAQQQLQLQAALAAAEQQWQQALANSPFADQAAFSAALLDSARQQALQQQIEGFRSERDRLSGAVESLTQALAGQQRPDPEQLQQQLAAANTAFGQADEQWRQLQQRTQQLQDLSAKLQSAHQTHAELEAQYAIYGTLSEVANGQTGDKISLQRFVLSVLLDDVLIQASQRLSLMSKGRYQLVRKEARAKGNKASGLELEVEDGYTGKSRPVATLSGGESFLAALSLALGLSDVVQAYAGGIKLDTLFIDEGFGSLDPESLELAIRTLIDLQASGRMIGIISHVSELKEQMALRLDVVAARNGSRIELVTG